MGHTPFGYKIENGKAVIDEACAEKIRKLYKNYLNGLSLSKAAEKAGIDTYHGTVKRIIENKHYVGDNFYPPIIDKETYKSAQTEIKNRAIQLGRDKKFKETAPRKVPTDFTFGIVAEFFDNPIKQAEYLYSLIESGVK